MDAVCLECREPLGEDGGCARCAGSADPPQEDGRLRARELDVSDGERAAKAVEALLEHRRRGRGRIIGMAGLPRHGKTRFADRLRERAAERPGVDLRYDKTERGRVNLYYIPGQRRHDVLIDLAGEDFQTLGDYSREVPVLMRQFLWPVLQRLDGLALMAALPILWAGWNDPSSAERRLPGEGEVEEMRRAVDRMVDAHRTLLKYAVVAADLRRLRRRFPSLDLAADRAPTRRQVDDAFGAAALLRAPVVVAFTKADLYAAGARPGLHPPAAGSPLHPLESDPLAVGARHFPELFAFLMERVRYFKFDFVQVVEDRSPTPNPNVTVAAETGIETLVGAESVIEFITAHPWRLPGPSTATVVRLDRRLNPGRWAASAVAGAAGGS